MGEAKLCRLNWFLHAPSPLLLLVAGVLAALVWWGPWLLVQLEVAKPEEAQRLMIVFYLYYLAAGLPASYTLVRFTELHCEGRCRPISRLVVLASLVPVGYAVALYLLQSWLHTHGRDERKSLEESEGGGAEARLLETPRMPPIDVAIALLSFCLNCAFYPVLVYRQLAMHLEAHYRVARSLWGRG